jgi:hypothetical protein
MPGPLGLPYEAISKAWDAMRMNARRFSFGCISLISMEMMGVPPFEIQVRFLA